MIHHRDHVTVSVPETLKCRSRSLKMAPSESLGTVSYSHSIATVAVSLAVSTQYTNVTDTQTEQEPRYAASLNCSRAAKMLWLCYVLFYMVS